jgi:hypothetical protein
LLARVAALGTLPARSLLLTGRSLLGLLPLLPSRALGARRPLRAARRQDAHEILIA